jgi:hypothetical protein
MSLFNNMENCTKKYTLAGKSGSGIRIAYAHNEIPE